MAKRERVNFELECTQCGKTGKVTYSENENPMHHDMRDDRLLERLSEGFTQTNRKDSSGDYVIECDTCKIPV